MRIEYNPRKFLLLVPLPMLRQYFDGRGVLGDLLWDDLTEKDYGTVYVAWHALSPRARDTIGADFLDVAGLATTKGIQVIIEEGKFHRKDLVAELAALPSHIEKAFFFDAGSLQLGGMQSPRQRLIFAPAPLLIDQKAEPF